MLYLFCLLFRWKTLNEIDSGVCDDMTYEDIIKTMPDEYKRGDADKFRYRYPRGESYEVRNLWLNIIFIKLDSQLFMYAFSLCFISYVTLFDMHCLCPGEGGHLGLEQQ